MRGGVNIGSLSDLGGQHASVVLDSLEVGCLGVNRECSVVTMPAAVDVPFPAPLMVLGNVLATLQTHCGATTDLATTQDIVWPRMSHSSGQQGQG